MSDLSHHLRSVGPLPFAAGFRSAWSSVFAYVLFGTYLGIGALAHDYGFSVWWVLVSTILVWAAPAQVLLISALGAGASWLEVAVAVTLSSVRLLPMVVALMPLLKGPHTRLRHLIVPAHFTAVSMWVESLRLLPGMPREERIAFCSGLGAGLVFSAVLATAIGFYLAAGLPPLLSAGLLFLTPMSFTVSVARNSRDLVDRLAFGFGLVAGPAFAAAHVGLDLMWTGVVGGGAAYAVGRLRRAGLRRGRP
jgi:predicted branched-subunit amino acid permease